MSKPASQVSSDLRAKAADLGVVVAGFLAVGATAWAWLSYMQITGMDDLMDPPCSLGTHLAVYGVGVACAAVAFAAILLVHGVAKRTEPRTISAPAITWAVAVSLWVGAIAFAVFLQVEARGGVLGGACRL